MSRPFDENRVPASLRYIVACQPLHEGLRQLVTQLGGLSLMTMLHREGTFDRETPLRLSRELFSEVQETLRGVPVPSSAAHHHHHMSEACRAIDRVCDLVAADPLTRDAEATKLELSRKLRSAADHLRFASRALPGFEMVDLGQSCCAAHAAAASAETTAELRL